MVKYSCKHPRVLQKCFWHALSVHKVSFFYALSKSEATMFFVFFLLFITMQILKK